MSGKVYILGAHRKLGGKPHEFGREFRVRGDGLTLGYAIYESRVVVTAPDGSRYVTPWERMEMEA